MGHDFGCINRLFMLFSITFSSAACSPLDPVKDPDATDLFIGKSAEMEVCLIGHHKRGQKVFIIFYEIPNCPTVF